MVTIYFYLDIKATLKNNKAGTANQPTWIDHPSFQWVDDTGKTSSVYPGGSDEKTPVPVPAEDGVNIYVVDHDATPGALMVPRPKYAVAIVRFLAGTWTAASGPKKGQAQTCTPQFLTSADAPITPVTFMNSHPNYKDFKYPTTGAPAWTKDDSYFTENNWFPKGAAGETQDTTLESPATHGPYITFNVSDIPGDLYYGVAVRISDDQGNADQYYCWDPVITVLPSS